MNQFAKGIGALGCLLILAGLLIVPLFFCCGAALVIMSGSKLPGDQPAAATSNP